MTDYLTFCRKCIAPRLFMFYVIISLKEIIINERNNRNFRKLQAQSAKN